MMWIKVFGVPCHAWNMDFFVNLANNLGSYICVDENTSSGKRNDTAWVLIRVSL